MLSIHIAKVRDMHVLVGIDGSSEADRAATYAATISSAMGGSVTIVHAVNPSVYDEGGPEPLSTLSERAQRLVIENIEHAEERALEMLERTARQLEAEDVEISQEVLYGDPVSAIPEYAEAHGVDGIYVGHRGRSARAERYLGSVAKTIIERASVPVTVVR